MKYTVVWKPVAERQLAAIWIATANRAAVTAAADQIDAILRIRPEEAGEARGAQRRVLVIEPLIVQFDVFDEDRSVQILRVKAIPRD